MKVRIAKIDNNKEYADISQIILPVTTGEIEILDNHAELFCLLSPGKITLVDSSGQTFTEEVREGNGHFKDNMLTVIL